jgi:hypothetical protein
MKSRAPAIPMTRADDGARVLHRKRRPDLLCVTQAGARVPSMIYDGTPRGERWLHEHFPVIPELLWEWLFPRPQARALLRVASRDGLRISLRHMDQIKTWFGHRRPHWHLVVRDGQCFSSTFLMLWVTLAQVKEQQRQLDGLNGRRR